MKSYAEICEGLEQSTDSELEELIKLCLGRILRLGSRPAQQGDAKEYDRYSYLAILAGRELEDRHTSMAKRQ
jgi:hypothetical protein